MFDANALSKDVQIVLYRVVSASHMVLSARLASTQAAPRMSRKLVFAARTDRPANGAKPKVVTR